MLQKSGRLVLWEAMFILELHSAETQGGLQLKFQAEHFALWKFQRNSPKRNSLNGKG